MIRRSSAAKAFAFLAASTTIAAADTPTSGPLTQEEVKCIRDELLARTPDAIPSRTRISNSKGINRVELRRTTGDITDVIVEDNGSKTPDLIIYATQTDKKIGGKVLPLGQSINGHGHIEQPLGDFFNANPEDIETHMHPLTDTYRDSDGQLRVNFTTLAQDPKNATALTVLDLLKDAHESVSVCNMSYSFGV